jgi:hypothetical protein
VVDRKGCQMGVGNQFRPTAERFRARMTLCAVNDGILPINQASAGKGTVTLP